MKRLFSIITCLSFLALAAVARADVTLSTAAAVTPAQADANTPAWVKAICDHVDCLNNFTAKTGYTFTQGFSHGEWVSGGFTDLKQSWYISPAPGFEKAMFNASEQAFFDANAVVKWGQFLSDKIPAIHSFVNSDPFAQGLLKYAVVGYSISYDFTNRTPRHGPWAGFTVKFNGIAG